MWNIVNKIIISTIASATGVYFIVLFTWLLNAFVSLRK